MRGTPIVVALLLANVANSQELMTAEQLIANSTKEEFAVPVAMYVAGWRDGTSLQLANLAEILRESGVEASRHADFQDALGRCLGTLGVADLVAHLKQWTVNDQIDPTRSSATAALMDVAIELCRGGLPETTTESGYVPGTPAWVPLIDDCMARGGVRSDCIGSLPPEVLEGFEASEQEAAARRRALMRNRNGEQALGVR